MKKLMIYGASGYTGRMAAGHAVAAGLDVVLAGRVTNEESLATLAREHGVDHRSFAVDDADAVREALEGVAVLLSCAGPFVHTARPLMTAVLATHTHYLDFAAELDSYRIAAEMDDVAKAAGVMLLPGSGGSVAMLGSLAGHAAARVNGARRIRIALRVSGAMSRGSAISASTSIAPGTLMMRDGKLVGRQPSEVRDFDFGGGPVSCFPVTLPDLLTIHRATGIPDVETFVHVAGGAFPSGDLAQLPAGPTAEERAASRYRAAVEVTGADGSTVRSVLDTVNGYSFTALAAAEAARRVTHGEVRPGFQTPASLFGIGFAETIADTRIFDI